MGFTGAVMKVGVCVFLTKHAGPIGLALAVSIQSGLLSTFLWNKVLTFRRIQRSPEYRTGIRAGLLRDESVFAPGGTLNAVPAFVLRWRGVALLLASMAGVMPGEAWNLLFNVPSVWRTWGPHSSRSEAVVQASARPAGSLRF